MKLDMQVLNNITQGDFRETPKKNLRSIFLVFETLWNWPFFDA